MDARGVEISGAKVQRAIARGVSVFQCDIDEGLADYPDQAFDYVILSQTLQETRHPRKVLREMLRVGRRAIVAFPNFGHWRMRMSMLFSGRAPAHLAVSLRVVRIAQYSLPDRARFRGAGARWKTWWWSGATSWPAIAKYPGSPISWRKWQYSWSAGDSRHEPTA